MSNTFWCNRPGETNTWYWRHGKRSQATWRQMTYSLPDAFLTPFFIALRIIIFWYWPSCTAAGSHRIGNIGLPKNRGAKKPVERKKMMSLGPPLIVSFIELSSFIIIIKVFGPFNGWPQVDEAVKRGEKNRKTKSIFTSWRYKLINWGTSHTSHIDSLEYCRKQGIYPVQLKKWKEDCIAGCRNAPDKKYIKEAKEKEKKYKKKQWLLKKTWGEKKKHWQRQRHFSFSKKKSRRTGGSQRTNDIHSRKRKSGIFNWRSL